MRVDEELFVCAEDQELRTDKRAEAVEDQKIEDQDFWAAILWIKASADIPLIILNLLTSNNIYFHACVLNH